MRLNARNHRFASEIFYISCFCYLCFSHLISLGSGKSSTMFGFNDDIGILRSSAIRILKHGTIFVTAVEFTNEESYDLASGIKVPMGKKFPNPIPETINTADEFDTLVLQAIKLRSQKSTNQNPTSSRSHLMFIMK